MEALAILDTEPRAKNAKLWERDPLDWYVEPTAATEALLRVERFVGRVWDPACGQGNIVNTLLQNGISAHGSDIADRGFGGVQDFLDPECEFTNVQNIVMNPPFFRAKGAEAFIRRALNIASGKIAVFLDIRFIAGAERANGLFKERPPHRIWIVTPRVSCPPGGYLSAGGKAEGGSSDWCWFIWDQTVLCHSTRLGWLRGGKAA